MILLTGTNGFIGQHLRSAVEAAYSKEEIVILRSSDGIAPPFLVHDGSTFDIAEMRRLPIRTVVHAGAFIPKDRSHSSDWKACASNVTSTAQLLESLPSSVASLTFLSTIDVYKNSSQKLDESSEIGPLSLYGHSKYYCERMVACWGESGNRIVHILRIGHIYGPGEDAFQKLIPVTIRNCCSGVAPEIWGDGDELRTFLFVSDCVRAILAATQLSDSSDVINVCGSDPVSVKNLVTTIVRLTGSESTISFLPSNAPRRDLVLDNERMRRSLVSVLTPLEEGLEIEVAHMKRLMGR